MENFITKEYYYIALNGSKHSSLEGVEKSNNRFWHMLKYGIIPKNEQNEHLLTTYFRNDATMIKPSCHDGKIERTKISFNKWTEKIINFANADKVFDFTEELKRDYVSALCDVHVICMTDYEKQEYDVMIGDAVEYINKIYEKQRVRARQQSHQQ